MRLHIELRDELVTAIDDVAGPRGRSRFIREALEQALKLRNQRDLLRSVRGSIDTGDWGEDPADWVREQRRSDDRRVG
jgi:predicted nucleic acid-binding protein